MKKWQVLVISDTGDTAWSHCTNSEKEAVDKYEEFVIATRDGENGRATTVVLVQVHRAINFRPDLGQVGA